MREREGWVSIDEVGCCRSQHTSIKENSGVWDARQGQNGRRGLGNDGEGKECLLYKGGILRSVDVREF